MVGALTWSFNIAAAHLAVLQRSNGRLRAFYVLPWAQARAVGEKLCKGTESSRSRCCFAVLHRIEPLPDKRADGNPVDMEFGFRTPPRIAVSV